MIGQNLWELVCEYKAGTQTYAFHTGRIFVSEEDCLKACDRVANDGFPKVVEDETWKARKVTLEPPSRVVK